MYICKQYVQIQSYSLAYPLFACFDLNCCLALWFGTRESVAAADSTYTVHAPTITRHAQLLYHCLLWQCVHCDVCVFAAVCVCVSKDTHIVVYTVCCDSHMHSIEHIYIHSNLCCFAALVSVSKYHGSLRASTFCNAASTQSRNRF
jgi:hypothetical protein